MSSSMLISFFPQLNYKIISIHFDDGVKRCFTHVRVSLKCLNSNRVCNVNTGRSVMVGLNCLTAALLRLPRMKVTF